MVKQLATSPVERHELATERQAANKRDEAASLLYLVMMVRERGLVIQLAVGEELSDQREIDERRRGPTTSFTLW